MRLLAFIGALALLFAFAIGGYFLGGFYNVSAVEADAGPVAWALSRTRAASISRRAPVTSPVSVDDAAVIQSGAKAFAARGCATCHGAPGAEWAKFSEGMRPDVADLAEVAKEDAVGHIFWVVKNGINMTGMPSFARIGATDEEIWRIAAFVKKLPGIKPEDYKAWTAAASQ